MADIIQFPGPEDEDQAIADSLTLPALRGLREVGVHFGLHFSGIDVEAGEREALQAECESLIRDLLKQAGITGIESGVEPALSFLMVTAKAGDMVAVTCVATLRDPVRLALRGSGETLFGNTWSNFGQTLSNTGSVREHIQKLIREVVGHFVTDAARADRQS